MSAQGQWTQYSSLETISEKRGSTSCIENYLRYLDNSLPEPITTRTVRNYLKDLSYEHVVKVKKWSSARHREQRTAWCLEHLNWTAKQCRNASFWWINILCTTEGKPMYNLAIQERKTPPRVFARNEHRRWRKDRSLGKHSGLLRVNASASQWEYQWHPVLDWFREGVGTIDRKDLSGKTNFLPERSRASSFLEDRTRENRKTILSWLRRAPTWIQSRCCGRSLTKDWPQNLFIQKPSSWNGFERNGTELIPICV